MVNRWQVFDGDEFRIVEIWRGDEPADARGAHALSDNVPKIDDGHFSSLNEILKANVSKKIFCNACVIILYLTPFWPSVRNKANGAFLCLKLKIWCCRINCNHKGIKFEWSIQNLFQGVFNSKKYK